jgi:transposase
MARRSKLLNDKVVAFAKDNLAKLGKNGEVAIKLRAIISAKEHGITFVAKAFGKTKATLISWIKHVHNELPELLSVQKGRGRKSLLTEAQKEIVKSWLFSDHSLSIIKVKERIKTEMAVDISRSTVHRLMKELNFSYITPRPKHYKQDKQPLAETKKKSSYHD